MNVYWIVYIVIYSLLCLGLFGSAQLYHHKGNKYPLKKVFVSFVYSSLLINEYMCAFNNWIIAEYFVGSIALFLSLYGLLVNFVNQSPLYKKVGFGSFFDLVVSIALSIRLIYIIEDDSLKAIIIPIVAAVFGGLITLAGVILTINHSNLQKKKEEIEKNKPILLPISDEMVKNLSNTIYYRNLDDKNGFGTLEEPDKPFWYRFGRINLHNSDNSICAIKGYAVDEKYRIFRYSVAMDKSTNNSFAPIFCFKLDKDPQSVSLLVEDMLSNVYKIDFSFDLYEERSCRIIKITGNLESNIIDFSKYQ